QSIIQRLASCKKDFRAPDGSSQLDPEPGDAIRRRGRKATRLQISARYSFRQGGERGAHDAPLSRYVLNSRQLWNKRDASWSCFLSEQSTNVEYESILRKWYLARQRGLALADASAA